MSLVATAAICFIACHGGPADYFATFSKNLNLENRIVDIYASGPAADKFKQRNISVTESFNADNLSSIELDALAKKIAGLYRKVVIDPAHPNNIKLVEAISKYSKDTVISVLYDNPEPWVPGEYSTTANTLISHPAVKEVWFVNANLAKEGVIQKKLGEPMDLSNKKLVPMGCYSVEQAEAMGEKRIAQHKAMREKLFSKNNLEDKGQKVLVYFGGNNTEYFNQAFPNFLHLLTKKNLSNIIIVMQQHPGAKKENIDGKQIEEWKKKYDKTPFAPTIIISNQTSDDMQILADAALYYQTSMGPAFALAGIPMIQVGNKEHEVYKDIIVKEKLCPSVITPSEFLRAIENIDTKITPLSEAQKSIIFTSLGIKKDWPTRLQQALE